jgi:ribose 5-phosphate isomerase B
MGNFKIVIGSDHGGFKLKEKITQHLREKNIEVKDMGAFDEQSCHYPLIAQKVCKKITEETYEKGILICGTGIGMSIAANKIKGIRAALCAETFSAKASRGHNDANVLCLGQRVTGEGLALEIVDVWLASDFEGGRHQIRIDMIEN